MAPVPKALIFYGALVNPVTLHNAQMLERALLAVNPAGVIAWLIEDVAPDKLEESAASKGWPLIDSNVDFIELKGGEFLMPGFIDTHCHAPQFPNLGRGQEYELLVWLREITFPTEEKFADLHYARSVYDKVVQRSLNFGTTTCCWYGTLHLEATKALADVVLSYGQRAFVGKCNMDREGSKEYVEDSASKSVEDTLELIDYIRALSTGSAYPLVYPILTPRFAICCTNELLEGLGGIARADPELAIQTHISENRSEIIYTKNILFPNLKTYANVYDHYDLLRDRTVLAHGVHLEDEEMDLIKARGAGISHCPTSNFNLTSGMARVGLMLDKGLKVGLGTDCSGGYSACILTAIRNASICSKMRALMESVEEQQPVTATTKFAGCLLPLNTLLYLATLGGAEVCGLAPVIGSFEQGKHFDAMLISLRSEVGNPNMWWDEINMEPLKEWMEKFFYCGDDRNIRHVWVQGRRVGGASTRT